MRALDHTQVKQDDNKEHVALFQNVTNWISQFSESIWLCITFLLFIVMGPFSVIAVLYGLWALATGESKERMVEPVRC